jgi:hypothetical protein
MTREGRADAKSAPARDGERRASLWRFLARLLLIYGALAALWLIADGAYRTGFCAAGNVLFGSFGAGGSATFQASPANKSDLDVEMILRSQRAPGSEGRAPISSYYVGYVPMISLLALVAATPINWRRRAQAMCFGVLLVHIFAWVYLACVLLHHFNEETPIRVFHLSSVIGNLVGFIRLGVAPSVFYCLVPSVIAWILVTFRREDVAWLDGVRHRRPAPEAGAVPPPSGAIRQTSTPAQSTGGAHVVRPPGDEDG